MGGAQIMRRPRPVSGNYETTEILMSSTSTRLPTPEGSGISHWVAEQAPEEMVEALTEFLASYREGGGDSL